MKRIFWCDQTTVSRFCFFNSIWKLKIKIITFGNVSQIPLFSTRCTISIANKQYVWKGQCCWKKGQLIKKQLYQIENVKWEIHLILRHSLLKNGQWFKCLSRIMLVFWNACLRRNAFCTKYSRQTSLTLFKIDIWNKV